MAIAVVKERLESGIVIPCGSKEWMDASGECRKNDRGTAITNNNIGAMSVLIWIKNVAGNDNEHGRQITQERSLLTEA